MKQLSADWFMEGTLDFEYKKYVLLAYLQFVNQEFSEERLYPSFSDLIFHYNNLFAFREKKRKIVERFPGKISREDLRKLRLVYQSEITDDDHMQEIDSIVDYSLPQIDRRLRQGKEIYDYIDERITIEPIGITPLYRKESYLLMRTEPDRDVKAFEYKIVFFENTDANYHGISFRYLHSFTYSLANTYESMKLQLVRSNAQLPNPATYLLYAERPFPEQNSLLPIAKRRMLSYLKEA